MTKSQIPILVFILIYLLSSLAFAFSFAVLGDNRDGDRIYSKILDKINSDKEISFIVNTGDFVSHGRASEYLKYLKSIKKSRVPIYHAMGNHDGVFGGWKLYKKYFGPDYYSFDHKNSHFVILNNAFKTSFDKTQYNWLMSDLEKNSDKNLFVFFHKPTFDATGFFDDHIMNDKRMADIMIGAFSRYKISYVFAGHIHGYARAERDGVVYIITAGAGAPLYLPRYAGGFNHYIKMTVDGNNIKDEVVEIKIPLDK